MRVQCGHYLVHRPRVHEASRVKRGQEERKGLEHDRPYLWCELAVELDFGIIPGPFVPDRSDPSRRKADYWTRTTVFTIVGVSRSESRDLFAGISRLEQ